MKFCSSYLWDSCKAVKWKKWEECVNTHRCTKDWIECKNAIFFKMISCSIMRFRFVASVVCCGQELIDRFCHAFLSVSNLDFLSSLNVNILVMIIAWMTALQHAVPFWFMSKFMSHHNHNHLHLYHFSLHFANTDNIYSYSHSKESLNTDQICYAN